MLYGVVRDGDKFWVIDQWGDRHNPICCTRTGPTQKVRSKLLQKDGSWKVDETRWFYKTPTCNNPATVCLGDSIEDLYCDEHKPSTA